VKLALLATTVVLAAGALAPAAASHSIVLPFSSRPADLQLYTVVVPTESDSPTTEVALKVPDGIDFLLVKESPGWQAKIERRDDRIDVIRWTGTAPLDSFAEFGLIARNPILEGPISWKITQTYGNGEVVRWIGPAGSEFPASVTQISEAAEPVDVATGLNGGDVPGSGGAASESEASSESATASDSSDTVARAGAAAALLIGLGALGATLLSRRRARRTQMREEG
jgi:uncharacterized protein YcnI